MCRPSMSTPRCLLLVVTEDWYFLSHRLALAQAARARGWRVIVATGRGERSAEIRAAGFEHRLLPLTRAGLSLRRELVAVVALWRCLRELEPDVVHLVAAKPIVYGNLAAAWAKSGAVLSAVAGLGYVYAGTDARRRLLRAVYEQAFRRLVRPSRSARVLVQNDDDLALLVRRSMARPEQITKVVGVGVDLERFRPSPEPPEHPLVILCHTRMLRDKGIVELVQASRLLRQRGDLPPFVVRLVGDPDAANPSSLAPRELEHWAREGEVEWLGQRRDIPTQLERCHVACLLSYQEGAPLSLIEAAAAGRPIVTTDVPGCREIVRDGDNGFLVPARDPAAAARALAALLVDPALRARMGRSARERAERELGLHAVNARVLELYDAMSTSAARARR